MKVFRRAVLAIAVAASLGACASVGPAPTTSANAPPVTPQQLSTAAILSEINDARRANGGHKPMTYNYKLEAACKTQIGLMIQKDQLAHDLGLKLRARTDMAGYVGAVGENLAGGQSTLAGAIEGWLNSPGHRATLLSDKFEEFGLAVGTVPADRKSRYRIYWCFIAGGPFAAWNTYVML